MSTKVTAGGANLQVLRQGAERAGEASRLVEIQQTIASIAGWGYEPKHDGWKHIGLTKLKATTTGVCIFVWLYVYIYIYIYTYIFIKYIYIYLSLSIHTCISHPFNMFVQLKPLAPNLEFFLHSFATRVVFKQSESPGAPWPKKSDPRHSNQGYLKIAGLQPWCPSWCPNDLRELGVQNREFTMLRNLFETIKQHT